MKDVERLLNEIITHSLADPGGDPDWSQCMTAAKALVVLDTLGLKVEWDRAELERTLTGANIANEDFLTGLRNEKTGDQR